MAEPQADIQSILAALGKACPRSRCGFNLANSMTQQRSALQFRRRTRRPLAFLAMAIRPRPHPQPQVATSLPCPQAARLVMETQAILCPHPH